MAPATCAYRWTAPTDTTTFMTAQRTGGILSCGVSRSGRKIFLMALSGSYSMPMKGSTGDPFKENRAVHRSSGPYPPHSLWSAGSVLFRSGSNACPGHIGSGPMSAMAHLPTAGRSAGHPAPAGPRPGASARSDDLGIHCSWSRIHCPGRAQRKAARLLFASGCGIP